jgi:hypothetical protein
MNLKNGESEKSWNSSKNWKCFGSNSLRLKAFFQTTKHLRKTKSASIATFHYIVLSSSQLTTGLPPYLEASKLAPLNMSNPPALCSADLLLSSVFLRTF